MRSRSIFETMVLTAFSAAVLVVGGLSVTTWKLANDANEAAQWVSHSHEVLSSLAKAGASTVQIELSTQSFRISGDPAHIAERDATIAAREALLRRIQQLTADNARQQERWTRLREVIDERLAISRRVQSLRNTEGIEAANAFAATAPLQETRERSSRLLGEMEAEERQLLENRNAEQLRTRQFMISSGMLVALLLVGVLTATYVLIRRQLRETEANQQALADNEESLSTTLHSIGDAVLATDADGRVTRLNPVAERLTGWPFAEARGRLVDEVFQIINEQTRAPAVVPVADVLATGNAQGLANHTALIARDGSECPIADSAAPIRDSAGEIRGVVLVFRDVTFERQADRTIREQKEQLERRVQERTAQLEHVSRALRTLSAGNRTMLRAADEQELLDGMCRAVVDTGGYDAAVAWYRGDDESRSLQPMAEHGYAAGLAGLRLLSAGWADNAHGDGVVTTAIRTGQASLARGTIADPAGRQATLDLPDYATAIACPLLVGGVVIGALAIYASEPDAFGADEITLLTESADDLAFGIATLRARAEQQKGQEAMVRLTRFDALTGLPNETQFTEFLTTAIDAGTSQNRPFTVLQTSIERLSEINDALGFGNGDQMLREFGARLRRAAPASAMVARLRGDEFAILLPDCDATAAIGVVQRLEEVLAPPFPVADIALDVTARIGVALFPEHGGTPHDLYRHMGIAVHLAKKKGVGHVVFNPAQTAVQSRRLTIASELRRAIEGGDLLLYLQPKVEMASGRICGAEGLVRWKHAEHGLIPPGEFIGLAENTGLIKPLTEWVMETALRLNQGWERQGCALPIAVNISARNLRDENLLEKICHLQATWGVASGLFEMEITESTVMEDAEFALHVLHGLREKGIALYIDDFGTGYSSLSYLQKLPVEYIKIDQSFVRDMSTRKDAELIVRSTIDLVHDLGRKVVAEGIETQESWDLLARLGCDIAQGYFIAKPMPSEGFQEWLAGFNASATTLASARAGVLG